MEKLRIYMVWHTLTRVSLSVQYRRKMTVKLKIPRELVKDTVKYLWGHLQRQLTKRGKTFSQCG